MTAIHRWLAEPLPRVVAQALERLAAAPGVRHVAVMPDVHLAEHVCVGTVLGTEDRLYPQAVGADIGCGMAAVRLLGDAAVLATADAAERTFLALRRHVPVIRRSEPQDVAVELSDPGLTRSVQRDARIELGTLGRGNHFLELQADAEEQLWLMVHSGSRAVGQAVLRHHLQRGAAVGGGLVALAAEGPGGCAYRHDVAQALAYAVVNRRAIAERAAMALGEALSLGVHWDTWFDCSHNFVAREQHADVELWVHRKGAIAAQDGRPGIIPGSMGSRSFHVEGRGCAAALCSSSHGAGRRMARGEAARRITVRDVERDLRSVWFERDRAAALRDEAPAAYKDIGAVMRAQRELTRIVRELRPVLAFKGT
jgi:tRNA-splicing ligase RtcB (3'-phosphate/5'-hydroxy nucleic acid ligase)